MATSTPHPSSNGDMRKQRGPNGSGQSPQHANMKPATGSFTSRSTMQSSSLASDGTGSLMDESDDDDSSASDEQDDSTKEADVFALSGEHSLAGHCMNDTYRNDMFQATAGAEEEEEVSPDGDYADVENISDDEDSVGDLHDGRLMRSAEQDLIQEFERTEHKHNANTMTEGMNEMLIQDDALARRLSPNSASDSPAFGDEPLRGVFGIDMNDDPFLGLSQNDGLYREMYDDAEEALGLWRLPDSDRNQQKSQDTSSNKKRVRFEDIERTVSRSSSLSSEDANDAFPDLFAGQDDPAVRQRFALDMDPDAAFHYDFDDAASFYDFDGEEERLALELDEEESDDDDDDVDDTGSSNSEDEGDTTDEETPEEQIARMRQMKKPTDKSPKLAPTTPRRAFLAASRASIPSRSSTPLSSSRGPRLGTFVLDKSRASMSADASGKQLKVFPPANPSDKDKAFWDRARLAARSRSSTPRSGAYWSVRSPMADSIPERPFTAQSTLGSMFNGNLDILRNNDVSGIAADMFPAVLPRAATVATSTVVDDDSEADIEDIDMQEFLDIEDSGSESDEHSTPVLSPGHPDPFESFTSLGSSRNDSGAGLLDHLDKNRGLVGSFRRNQTQAKHVSSLASNAAKRASTSEYNALQKGRRAAANTPMTPARKKRHSQDLSLTGAGVRKSVSSPLTGRRPRSRGGSLSGVHQTLSPSLMR